MSDEHISRTEITRRVKGVLRKAFPSASFAINSHSSDIWVRWTDDGISEKPDPPARTRERPRDHRKAHAPNRRDRRQGLEDTRAHYRRGSLRQRGIELAMARVLEFAGAPGLQMQAASRLWGHCFNCGKELTDPVSLERGIGPDCLVGKVKYIRFMAKYLGQSPPWFFPPITVTFERIVFWSAMPPDFVKATIDEIPIGERAA